MSGRHEEYLRRNLIHAKSVGLRHGLVKALLRVANTKRMPQWLFDELFFLYVRSIEVPGELAKWRNTAPDAPLRQQHPGETGNPYD